MEEVTDEDARRRCGERLCMGLGVVDEKTKIRVVHDGSHGVHVNHRIKTRDQVRIPGRGELETLLVEMKADNWRSAAIIGDAQKAHRRVKVRKEDWVYMACRLTGKVWHLWLRIGRVLLESAGSGGVGQDGLLSDWTKMVTGSAALRRRLDHPGRARV